MDNIPKQSHNNNTSIQTWEKNLIRNVIRKLKNCFKYLKIYKILPIQAKYISNHPKSVADINIFEYIRKFTKKGSFIHNL